VDWVWGSVSADRPSAIELLLGREQAIQVFRWVTGCWGTAVGAMAVVVSLGVRGADLEGVNADGALAVAVLALAFGLGFLLVGNRASERGLDTLNLGAVVGMVAELHFLGPRFEMAIVVLGLAGVQSLLYLRRRLAVGAHLLLFACYSAVVSTQDGYPLPGLRVLIFVTALLATSSVFGWVVGHIEGLAANERGMREQLAQAHADLAAANQRLEERVDEQGAEIGSLSRLRQFLSPQVAEAVLQEGIEALAPHRCRIAVIFCDLRGFTTFSTSAEPEEVMEVLDRYYVTVGRSLHEGGATVGSFAGDGIMAYFGDPVPCEDAAGTAVQMAVELGQQMSAVVSGWRRRGFDVGCGMGIAYGYATIGPVGFDERTDYTALGPTVNLASRLCNMAADGEILIDGRAREAVEGRVVCDERIVDVRGFRLPIHAYNVTEWVG
jgi:class 3 adenylate cyclase